jgi:hypothetical protein
MALRERIFRRHRGDAAVAPDGEQVPAPPADDVTIIDAPAVDAVGAPPAEPVAAGQPAADGEHTMVMPAVSGEAVEVPPGRPGFRARGRMRRRLRYLREVRELGYRDLGGLVFDQHRFGRPNEALVQGKVSAIDAIDRESRALGAALADRATYSELFVAGVSACQRCGGLHGSDARFCPNCGLAFGGPRTLAGVGAEHHAPAEPGMHEPPPAAQEPAVNERPAAGADTAHSPVPGAADAPDTDPPASAPHADPAP